MRILPFLLAIVVPLVLAGCGERLPTYRYRMTVIVDTPEGVRTGSSVIEVRTFTSPEFPGPEAGGVITRYYGEAPVVDLGGRGLLFATLQGADRYAADTSYGERMNTGNVDERRRKIRRLMEMPGIENMRPRRYPMLVHFRDIDDPNTVEHVDPENLAASFGPGYRLDGITIEMTNDRPTESIGSRFSWWDHYRSNRLRV